MKYLYDAIVSAIAIHPNMTKELLIELARNDDPYDDDEANYFYQTDQNPVMDLLLSEHPMRLCFAEGSTLQPAIAIAKFPTVL